MLRRFFVIVALVALLSPGTLAALSPDMDPDGAPTAETTSGPEDDTELSPDMDPNGLHAPREEGIHYATALIALDEAETACLLGNLDHMAAMVEEASILLVKAAAKHEALAVIRLPLRTIEGQTVTRATLAQARQRIAALKPS
ncbi:MAG: hypothetical protein ACOC7L_01000 [Acidobacteriota bacterium]